MSKCVFSIEFNGSIDTLIEKANSAISAKGGKFEGDTLSGQFALQTLLGAIEGTYKVTIGAVVFEITNKPFFVPCGKIEEELRKYLPPSTPTIA
jgi:hypothetical protein